MDNLLISIVIPTYNELGNIVPFCHAVFTALKNYETEIIVVDDDSPDGTAEEVLRYAKEERRVKLIIRKGTRSLASAVREGITASRGGIIVRTDADFQLRPDDVLRMVEETMNGNDFVFVSRYVKGGKDLRRDGLTVFSSYVINAFCQIMLSPRYKDYTSCLFACRREVFDKVSIEGEHGELFISLLWQVHKAGFSIKEISYHLLPRRWGYSKTATNLLEYLKKGRKYLIAALRLKLNREINQDKRQLSLPDLIG